MDLKYKSAMLDVGNAAIPLYLQEPHQFIGAICLVAFDLMKNQKLSLEELLLRLGSGAEQDRWREDLARSGLVDQIGEVLRSNGLERDMETPVGRKHKLAYCTLLYLLCRLVNPTVVVETGVGVGTSTAFILQAMVDNNHGELYSIEKVRDWRIGILVSERLRERWHLVSGGSRDKLPKLVENKTVDVFIHDSEHSYRNMRFEYQTVWPKIRAGGYLLSDDVVSNFSFYKFMSAASISLAAVVDEFGIIKKST